MDFELTREQVDIRRAVREFAEKEFTSDFARQCDQREEFPRDLYRRAADLGFVSPHVPAEYGGQGLGYMERGLCTEEFCRADSTLGTALTLGPFGSDLILMYGTEEQKKKYLPKITSGQWASSGAFTEPGHGSDLTIIDTTATPDGEGWTINGTKTLISNAPIADFAVVYCQTTPGVQYRGQSLFVVDKGTEGFSVTKLEGKMGIRASLLGEISLSNCCVPAESLVGEKNRGFSHILEFLDKGRIGVAFEAVGIAQGAIERAIKYARERTQFGQRVIDFQVIQHKLADMLTQVEAARLLSYKAAWNVDKGRTIPELSSMAKAFATTTAVRVVDDALQIFGGYGYLADYDLERYYRDIRITTLYEGTTEIQKNTIARMFLNKK